MITMDQYVGKWRTSQDWNPVRQVNAKILLDKVNSLLDEFTAATGFQIEINPATGSQVSGSEYGGFRPQSCTEGAPHSSHKEGMAVDVFDDGDRLDKWLTDEILEKHDLYREHPSATYWGSDKKPHPWCHLTTRAPGSGHRTFYP